MKTLHTTQKPLVCEFCGQSFKKFAPFTLHVKSHIQKHEKCPETGCGMTFLQGQDMTKHLKIAHGIDKKPFSCDKCKETFSLATDLTVHVMQRHEKQQSGSKWKCPECEKEFSYPSHLKQHMVSHLGEKNFVCKVCEKSYFKASNLRRHYQNSHLTIYKEMVANGELRRVKADDELELKVEVQKNIKNRRHKCSEPNCNASFNQARHLQEHLESKHGLEVMYQCDDCDSAFEDVINLRLHRKEVHSLKGPHICDACQKVFPYPSLLRNHIAVVHHGENFFCELCSRSFSRNSHLLRHLREAHTDFYEQNVREGKITPRKSRKKI
ncbi:zinc finger protein 253-like [Culicoides brevitarsis]|uniref:zinc finger protein 253-like n=1 Tax=Culicoides brevitarsis TaxID=469753 RepID=UPI00307B1124